MRIVVIGLGYAGIVNVAALLQMGHVVTGVDIDDEIRNKVARGASPIREPGVAEMIAAGRKTGRLAVTEAIADDANADLVFVCVGTRGLADGMLDLSEVTAVSRELGGAVRRRSAHLPPLLIVFRSTMLPGTMRDVLLPVIIKACGEQPGARYEVAYSPEFTREGSALTDYLAPSRIVVGEREPGVAQLLQDVMVGTHAAIFTTSFEVAELAKCTDNAFHALKVAFANEIGRFAQASGISADDVFNVFHADTKLNLSGAYLRPGGPFGGPCLPKDMHALATRMKETGVVAPMLDKVLDSNRAHVDFVVAEIERRVRPRARILLVGLSFKTGSDDMRGSPFISISNALLDDGHYLSIYDPDVTYDSGNQAELPSRLSNILLPESSVGAVDWDLVVVGKRKVDLEGPIDRDCPRFHIDRL